MLTVYGEIICDWCGFPMIKHQLDRDSWEDEDGEAHGWHWKLASDHICETCADRHLLYICRNECKAYRAKRRLPCERGECWHNPPWPYETYFSDRQKLSRQRGRIYKEALKAGIRICRLEWEAIGKGGEKCGPSGGWFLETTNGEALLGYNVSEVLESIQTHHRDALVVTESL